MSRTKTRIIKIIMFAVAIAAIGIVLQISFNKSTAKTEQVLNRGWNVSVGDKSFENADLSTLRLPELKKGDKVTMSTTLPSTPYKQTAFRIQTRYSAVAIYLEDEMIYESGISYYEEGKVIGNGYHWIPLPEDYIGKTLTVVYNIGEDDAFSAIDKLILIDSQHIFTNLVNTHLITCIIACCLIVIAIVSIGCMLLMTADKRFHMLLWLGLFSAFVSMWMLCNSRVVEGITQNLYVICHLEYIGMYGACASMLMFVSSFFRGRLEKRFFKIYTVGFFAMSILLIILNDTNIIHFPKTGFIFQIVATISIVMVIYLLIKEVKQQKKAERIILGGVVAMFLCAILELARYRYNKLCLPVNMLNQSIISVGALIFILSMFGGFFVRIMEHVAADMERKTLYEMAYNDALTNLKNRAWCEKVMDDYEKASRPITIINMDLNLFKQVNDSYGHSVGDELLIRFADIMLSVFGRDMCVGRMGGDEFVIISDYLTDAQVQEYMRVLNEKITAENNKHEHLYDISVAFGYASDDTGNAVTPWKLYEMADRNMYQYKRELRS